jgi:HlyD family secretion protein
MKKWFIIPSLIILIAIVWLVARPDNEDVRATPFSPQIEKITRGDIRVEVSATGIIEPINKVEIKSKASGLIDELRIEEADFVNKGDLIARLDQRDTKNAYDQAVAELEVAQATVTQRESDFQRKKDLYEKGLISATEFEESRLSLVEAQSQVVRAKINVDNNDIRLKDTIVRSPIKGVILTKDVEEGQIISSGISSVTGGTLIATVADMNEVYVKADVDEVDIGTIAPGMQAQVVADAYPSQVFNGQVVRIAAQAKVDQNVTSFEVTIHVNNPSGILKAGMNASVEILVADKKDVILLPNEALMTLKETQQELAKIRMAMGQDGRNSNKSEKSLGDMPPRPQQRNKETGNNLSSSRHGVIIKQGNDFEIRPVNIGISNFDYTEIINGLNDGDEVVYTYYSRAKESSDRFLQRISSRASMQSGFRSTNNSNSR